MSDKETTEPKYAQPEEIDPKWARAERILGSIRPGWSITIRRIRPGWCGGYLERVECSDEEPIDIDYIIEQWGGRIIQLRVCDERGKFVGGADINLQSYPPKHEGVLITKKSGQSDVEKNPVQPVIQQVAPQPQQSQQLNLVELLGLIQKTRSQDLGVLRTLLGDVQQPQQVVQQAGGLGTLDGVIEFAGKWKELQAVFGQPTEQSQSDDAGLLGSITQIMQMVNANKQTAPQQKPQQPRPQSRVVHSGRAPVPVPNPAQQQPNPERLSSVLADMDVDTFKNTFLTSLSKMPEDKRETILEQFMESGIPGDDVDEDEYYQDEPEEIKQTDPGPDRRSWGNDPANDDDDPTDR